MKTHTSLGTIVYNNRTVEFEEVIDQITVTTWGNGGGLTLPKRIVGRTVTLFIHPEKRTK